MVGAYKLSYWLKEKLNPDAFQRYARIIKSNVTKEGLDSICRYEFDYRIYKTELIRDRYKKIFEQCRKSEIATTCIELALLEYIDNAANEVFGIITGNVDRGVSLDLAAKIAMPEEALLNLSKEISEARKIVERVLVLEHIYSDSIRDTFRVDLTLLNYLNGVDISDICREMDISGSSSINQNPNKNYGASVRLYDFQKDMESSILFQKEINQISNEVSRITETDELCPVIHIMGERQSGKKFMIRHISKRLQHNLLTYAYVETENGEEFARIIQKLKRTVFIAEAVLCICISAQEKNEKSKEVIEKIVKIIANLENDGEKKEIFIASDSTFKIIPYIDNVVCQMEIKKPDEVQSFMLWKNFLIQFLGEQQAEKIDIRELAVKMKVAAGYVKKIAHQLKYADSDKIQNEKFLSKICYMILNDGKYDDIKHIESGYSWEDLKLEAAQKNILKDIYSHVKYRLKVYEDFGLRQQFQYGRCISALFSGPSGTGKTMAVYVLANMLNLELYKVDLSKVVDKYIGEAEKRLEEIFKRAENSNMILFFDEADALFGKRSEINDARDKYANTEVAYILQRIEEFDGIVILSTNYRENVDVAFMRRMKYEVRFSMPSKEIREEIWRNVLGGKVMTDFIDYEYLADTFEFSGAAIKNVALNAVFKAVSQDKAVFMAHIIWAIRVEYEKTGKMVFQEEFGKYGYLIGELEKEIVEK